MRRILILSDIKNINKRLQNMIVNIQFLALTRFVAILLRLNAGSRNRLRRSRKSNKVKLLASGMIFLLRCSFQFCKGSHNVEYARPR